ncbi:MAG: extradiol dioxygenase [Bryobacteraceae bacterium]|jgi:catechol 2,3-dioxygenase-like lactoylglutathione lyase family enzyme
MIIGSHVLLYSKDPDADRAFFSDVLELHSVDAGGGWLIFALPPAEVAVHPADDDTGGRKFLHTQLYLMCDDLPATIKSLEAKKIKCTEVAKERWGIRTTIVLPSGGEIGLYQPKHPTAFQKS